MMPLMSSGPVRVWPNLKQTDPRQAPTLPAPLIKGRRVPQAGVMTEGSGSLERPR